MTAVPLRRSRDFMLLQVAGLLSSGGSQMTAIPYPPLVLSLTGSAARAGRRGVPGPVRWLDLPCQVSFHDSSR